MKRGHLLAVVLTLSVVLLTAAIGRGNWLHQVVSLGALVWLGIPLLVIAAVLALRRKFGAAIPVLGLVTAIGLQLLVGLGILQWDIHRSRQYCESLVPILDDIYRREGRYPLSIADDPRLPLPPAWQFDTGLINYYSDGSSFSFDVHNPAELFGGFLYHHHTRTWTEWRD